MNKELRLVLDTFGLGFCWAGGTIALVVVEVPSTGGLLGTSSCITESLRRIEGEGGKDFGLFPSDLAGAPTGR